jgi:hypothetical protein
MSVKEFSAAPAVHGDMVALVAVTIGDSEQRVSVYGPDEVTLAVRAMSLLSMDMRRRLPGSDPRLEITTWARLSKCLEPACDELITRALRRQDAHGNALGEETGRVRCVYHGAMKFIPGYAEAVDR